MSYGRFSTKNQPTSKEVANFLNRYMLHYNQNIDLILKRGEIYEEQNDIFSNIITLYSYLAHRLQ